jgi:hypothetical protein
VKPRINTNKHENKKKIFYAILIAFIVSLAFAQSEESFLERAAKELGKKVSDLRLDQSDLEYYGYGKFRPKLFDQFIYNPLKIAPFTRVYARTLLDNADSLWTIAYFPWARIDEGVRRGLIDRPDKVLLDSINKIPDHRKALIGLLLKDFGVKNVDLQTLSDTMVLGLLLLTSEIKNSLEWIKNGTSAISKSDIDTIIKGLTEQGEDGLSNPRIEQLIESTDFKSLAAGAMDLGYVINTVVKIFRKCTLDTIFMMSAQQPVGSNKLSEFISISALPTDRPFTIDTKYGKIVFGSAYNDIYDKGPYLLIVDYGGNDEYKDCAISSKNNPVSIVIDFNGNDTYHGKIGAGTGICGYGIVYDLNGDDIYQAEQFGLGTGIFGEGIVLDLSGNDKYSVEKYGEGAGLFGAGILSDISGDDYYEGFQGCQGFGFVKGCGVLVDRAGNDKYIARDDTVKYPSPQTSEHNVSLSQGTGFGVRADFTDGHSLAGGVGMLIDGSGDDKYSCGVFGQGCGYWFGSGILLDYQGNDEYNGVWYIQGASAHFALGVLIDSAGNDKYNSLINMSQGSGHDFSLGMLVDYQGDDFYNAYNLSLGGGNANGMGLFIDYSGNDEYLTHQGIVLGNCSIASRGGLRDYMKCIGVFIDGNGNDKYNEPFAKNHKTWKQTPPLKPPLKTEWSIGIDY